MNRRDFTIGGLMAAGFLSSRAALAADSLIKFINPYAPGSGGDVLVRVLADDLQKKLGISAIVDNKPGADGRIGVREVKHAEPDGNTLLFTPFGRMTSSIVIGSRMALRRPKTPTSREKGCAVAIKRSRIRPKRWARMNRV